MTFQLEVTVEADANASRTRKGSIGGNVVRSLIPGRRKKSATPAESPPPMGITEGKTGVTVVKHGVLTEDFGGHSHETFSDESGRTSMVDWIKDVLPSHLRHSRHSRSRSSGSLHSGASSPKRNTPRGSAVRHVDEPLTTAEMMSEAHRQQVIKELRAEAAAERERADSTTPARLKSFAKSIVDRGKKGSGKSAKAPESSKARSGSNAGISHPTTSGVESSEQQISGNL